MAALRLNHTVEVAGQSVDDDVISIRVDGNMEQSEPDRADVVLANTNGKWDGAFKTNDTLKITIWVEHMKCDRSTGMPVVKQVDTHKILNGLVQKVNYTHSEVKIEGACNLSSLADALTKEYHYHPKDVKSILEEVLGNHTNPPIKIKEIDYLQDIKERETVFKPDWKYEDVCDYLADLVGAIWYFDEDGEFVFVDPMKFGDTHYIDPYIINEDKTHSCIGHCNVVTVMGGGINEVGKPGDEIENTQKVWSATKRNEESIAKHGELIAPTFYCPYLTTQAQCEKRAENLLEYYKGKEDVATPIIAGYTVPLRSVVVYSVNGVVIEGMVTRRVVEYSVEGFTTKLWVSEGAMGAKYTELSNTEDSESVE